MATVGKPITCKAAVVWEKGETFSVETVEVDVPKKNEVRIKITSSGICHSDVHMQEGEDPFCTFPVILGHEAAGFVESVGEGVTKVQPGDLVVGVFESYCEECDFCKNPKTNFCHKQPWDNKQMDGTTRVTCRGKPITQMCSLGSFAEYIVTSEYNCTKVDPKADPSTLCLAGCCIPTGYGAAVNAAKVTPGSTCAIWGLGGVGMCVLMGCRDSRAAKIIGIDTNPKKFELAKQFGATEFLNPREVEDVPKALAEMTSGGPDYCFASVGNVSVMETAFKSSHPHWGKTVIIGLSDDTAAVKAGVWDLLYGRSLYGTYYGSYKAGRDIPQLVDKVINGTIQLKRLVSHRLPLDKINEGFKMLTTGESLRAVIDFSLKE